MTSAKDVTVRSAVFEDCKGILEIEVEDDLEQGLDQEILDDWFEETWVHLFVAEYNDVVIGFIMLKEVDEDGKGGQLDALRVAKKYRDRKIGDKLFRHAIYYAQNETDVEYIRGLTVKPLPQRFGAEVIGKSMYLNYEGDAKTLRTTLQSAPGLDDLPLAAVVPFKPRHLRKMLDPAVCENVLTNGFLFADGDIFTLCGENLAEFCRDEKCMFVDKNQPIRSISFGSGFDCSKEAVRTIDVNCSDIELFKSHMIKQMQRACADNEGTIIFSFSATCFEDEIKAFCEGIEGLEVSDKPGYKGVFWKIALSRE